MKDLRDRRPRPHLDDKVLAGWNGLMIAAFARGARVLQAFEPAGGAVSAAACLKAAVQAARFIRQTMWDEKRRILFRRFRQGDVSIDAYCEDYAFLVWGLLELAQASGEAEWLVWAAELQKRQNELFWDETEGGWFSTDGRDPSVLLRMKEEHDGAEPSAGSVSVLNLLTIAHLTGDADALRRAERTLQKHGPQLAQMARVLPMMMAALAVYHGPAQQVAIVGPWSREDTRKLHVVLETGYRPFTLTVPVEPGAQQTALAAELPWIGAMTMKDGQATAYVCENFVCREPVTGAEELGRYLQ
jgi:hypothetical protein